MNEIKRAIQIGFFLGIAIVFMIQGCGGECLNGLVDSDGDGYFAGPTRGDDCDDSRKLVFPGAKELCDGLDNNCDGVVDEGCGPAPKTCEKDCEPKPTPDPTPDPEPTDCVLPCAGSVSISCGGYHITIFNGAEHVDPGLTGWDTLTYKVADLFKNRPWVDVRCDGTESETSGKQNSKLTVTFTDTKNCEWLKNPFFSDRFEEGGINVEIYPHKKAEQCRLDDCTTHPGCLSKHPELQ